jgi:hypothetical protein
MEATLEYIAVGLLIILLILAAFGMMTTVTSTTETTYEEQLYTIAERVMDKLILTPGYPVDWGTNIQVTPDTLQDFGLTLYGARSPYIVDPDKVMRLANLSTLPNPLLLNTTRLAQLLNLEGYGFRLKIRPMLLINITPAGYYSPKQGYTFISAYDFLVTNYYGLGIPNANITAMYVVVRVQPGASNTEGDVEAKTILTKTCLTDAVGKCSIDYESDLRSYFNNLQTNKWYYTFLIARAEWQGFISVAGYASTSQEGVPAEGYIIGNYVFVNKDIDTPVIMKGNKNAGAVLVKDDLLQAVPEYQDLLNFTTVTWCRDASGNFRSDDPLCNNAGRVLPSAKQWYLVGYVQYVEPLSSHIFIFAQFRGNPVAIVISRLPNIDIAYGGKTALPANSVTLRRVCTIYSYPYVVELTIWRRVEGFP